MDSGSAQSTAESAGAAGVEVEVVVEIDVVEALDEVASTVEVEDVSEDVVMVEVLEDSAAGLVWGRWRAEGGIVAAAPGDRHNK
jgi:hypothetical protein